MNGYKFNELTAEAQDNAIQEACSAYKTFMGPLPGQVYKENIAQLLQDNGFMFNEDGTPII